MGIVTNFNSSKISTSNAYVPYSNKSSISNAYVCNSNTNYINPIKSETMDFSNLIIDNFNNNDNKDDAKIKYTEASHGILDDEKAQGMTKTDKYVYISAHDPDDKLGSRIYVYDRYNGDYLGFIRLADFNDKEDITNNSHVGGITYDKDHDILYVTEYSGEIVAYNNKTIEKYIEDSEIIKVKNKLLEYAENDKLVDIAHDNLIYVDSTNFAQKIDELFDNIKDTDIYQYLSEKLSFIDIKKLQDEIKKDLPSYIEKSRNEKNCLIDMRLISKNDYESDFHIQTQKVDNKYLLFKNKEINVTEDGQNAATTYYHDGILYSATYETNGKGEIKAYRVINRYNKTLNKTILEYELLFTTEAPRQTQGIAVTEYNGKKYLLTSQSLGYNSSTITTSIINDDGTVEELGYHEFWDYMGMQGLYVNDNNEITCISEFQNKTKNINMSQLTSNFVDEHDYKHMRHKLLQDINGYIYKKEYKNDIDEITDSFKYVGNDFMSDPISTVKGIATEIPNAITDDIDDIKKASNFSYNYTKSKTMDYINDPSGELLNDLETLYGKGIMIQTISKEGLYKIKEGTYKIVKPVVNEINKDVSITKDFYKEVSKHSAGEVVKDFSGEVVNTLEDYGEDIKDGTKKIASKVDDYVPDAVKPWKWHF